MLLNLGASLLEQGKAEDALGYLEQAYQLDAPNVPLCINLGGAYIMTGHHKKAIPILEAACDSEPHNTMIWINLAAAYLGNPVLATTEQQNQAIAAFETALRYNPAAPNVHYNLGLIFIDRGDQDRAIAAFRQAIQVDPFDRDAHLWLRRLEAPEKGQEGGTEDDP